MQNRTIQDEELNSLLVQTVRSSLVYYSETSDYLQDLYFTGCRSQEPLQIERWTAVGDIVKLRTAKVDAERTFKAHNLSNSLINAISGRYKPYSSLTYDQLTLEFRKVFPLHPIYAGSRIADTYLFRYNRARQHYNDWHNLPQLMDFFGWLSPTVALNYVHQPLIYCPTNEP